MKHYCVVLCRLPGHSLNWKNLISFLPRTLNMKKRNSSSPPPPEKSNDTLGWTEVSSKKTKKKTPPNSPSFTPQTPPPLNTDDSGLSMDLSDEVMFDLSVAHDSPPQTQGDCEDTIMLSSPPDNHDHTTQPTDNPSSPKKIINPYSCASKERLEKIKQAAHSEIQKSYVPRHRFTSRNVTWQFSFPH